MYNERNMYICANGTDMNQKKKKYLLRNIHKMHISMNEKKIFYYLLYRVA